MPAVVVTPDELAPESLPDGGTRRTVDMHLDVAKPGQVTVMTWDAGPYSGQNRLEGSIRGSTFAADTLFHVGESRGDAAQDGSSLSSGGAPGTADDFGLTLYAFSHVHTFFAYAGPTATGAATLRLEEYEW